ncbi:MAG: hypothetical protein C5B50_06735 [Verrucomicrobia bacterium]|nr:MAG: hypothetical protein C5B50_06735 [Verrucomicrobiota bacterium]
MRIAPRGWIWIAALAGLLAGCNPMDKVGKPLVFPKDTDSVLFGISSFADLSITNQYGYPVPGLILRDASLIENDRELADSTRGQFAIIRDFLLGNGVRGDYWQQQSEKRVGLGLPWMDTHSTEVLLVDVDSNRVVKTCKSIRVAHVTISVDTNDFSRTFKP